MTEEDMGTSCTFDTRVVGGNTMKWSMDCTSQWTCRARPWL
jgi:hypothetical protein